MRTYLSLPGGISHRWCHPSHYTIVVYIYGERTAKKINGSINVRMS